MKLLTVAACVACMALTTTSEALRISTTDAAPPADIRGEHQELERIWAIHGKDALAKLTVAIPGPVFVHYDATLRHPVQDEKKEAPAKGESGVITPTAGSASDVEAGSAEAGSLETGSVDVEVSSVGAGSIDVPVSVEAGSEAGEVDVTISIETGSVDQESGSVEAEVIIVDDGNALSGSYPEEIDAGSFAGSLFNDTQVLSRRLRKHEEDSDDSDDDKKKPIVAKIVVTGTSPDLLNLVEVLPLEKGSDEGLIVHLKNQDAKAEGFILTHIYVAEENVVAEISATLAHTVDVASGVLVTKDEDAKVKLAYTGTGDLLVSEKKIAVKSVELDLTGTGLLQLQTSSLETDDKVSSNVVGTGAIAVHADSLHSADVKNSVTGAGKLYISAQKLSADEVDTSVYGASVASVHVSVHGKTNKEKISVSGSGAVLAGSVKADEAEVSIWGTGQAFVQAKDKIRASAAFFGDVYYVGDKPEKIETHGFFFGSLVKPAAQDNVVEHSAVESPVNYPGYVALQLKKARHEVNPSVKEVPFGSVSMSLSAKISSIAHGPNAFLVFGCVAVAMAAAGVAMHAYQQHRVRRHYMPLV
ncbi:hypothetical protein Poli38472_010819 [Pythium oligandrum]|uniref:Putative auto-transporter adhesin head GIN domain-containing protein n=1 Tax=Pythium oligandrum TaxID=41045 RepID=A0A8K1FGK7_PYTOL|nr:hypothetical protein Poli38472_010819 [Pythium oligandrum]|eukprot:TMW61756.1 hypothetical protein Poli38472_010819 [Pythium oligandrum]